jgi:hypothetical protein
MAGRIGLFVLTDDASDTSGLRGLLQQALAMLGEVHVTPPGGTGTFPTGHVATTTDGSGRVTCAEGTAPKELSDAIRNHFPQEVWSDAARISYYESSWKHDATNDTRHLAGGLCGQRYWLASAGIWASTEYSVGYFQINICAHGQDAEYWYDADHNVSKAADLYAARGNAWDDWAYTAGRLGLL